MRVEAAAVRGAKHTFLWLLYHDAKTIVNLAGCEI